MLYLSKPSPLALVLCPWWARIPTDRKLPSLKLILRPSHDVCRRFVLGVGISSTSASSNNNTANPTFLPCHALIARLLIEGKSIDSKCALHNQPHAWFGGVKLIGHVSIELDRIKWSICSPPLINADETMFYTEIA